MVSSAFPFPDASHQIVCRGRYRRDVVCRSHHGRTEPAVLTAAVLIAVLGLTGLSWTTGASPAVGAHQHAAAPRHLAPRRLAQQQAAHR